MKTRLWMMIVLTLLLTVGTYADKSSKSEEAEERVSWETVSIVCFRGS